MNGLSTHHQGGFTCDWNPPARESGSFAEYLAKVGALRKTFLKHYAAERTLSDGWALQKFSEDINAAAAELSAPSHSRQGNGHEESVAVTGQQMAQLWKGNFPLTFPLVRAMAGALARKGLSGEFYDLFLSGGREAVGVYHKELHDRLLSLRALNPAHARNKRSLPELVELAYQRQLNVTGLVKLIEETWEDRSGKFTLDRLIAHCRGHLQAKGHAEAALPNDEQLVSWIKKANSSSKNLRQCMDFFAAASDMPLAQRFMFWRLKRGTFIAAQDIERMIDSGDRAKTCTALLEATGIPTKEYEPVCAMTEAVDYLRLQGTPLTNHPKTQLLSALLVPHSLGAKTQSLRHRLKYFLMDVELPPSLTDLMLQAMEKSPDNPKRYFIHAIAGSEKMTGLNFQSDAALGELFATAKRKGTKSTGHHYRAGETSFTEHQADVLIRLAEEAGVEVSEEEREDVRTFLTEIKPVSQLWEDAIRGKVNEATGRRDPGDCLPLFDMVELTRKRRGEVSQRDVQGISATVFNNLYQGRTLECESGWALADFIGLTEFNEKRCFVVKAMGNQPIEDILPVVAQLKEGAIERAAGLKILIEQTGKTARHLCKKYNETGHSVPYPTMQNWIRQGFIPDKDFISFLAQELLGGSNEAAQDIQTLGNDLDYLFHAARSSSPTPFTESLESRRQGHLSRVAAVLRGREAEENPREI